MIFLAIIAASQTLPAFQGAAEVLVRVFFGLADDAPTQENQGLRDRAQAAEQQVAMEDQGARRECYRQSRLPEVLEKMSKGGGGGLIDQKGLGKRRCLEMELKIGSGLVAGVIGGKTREVLEWVAEQENNITQPSLGRLLQLYTILRATTKGAVFDLVENAPKSAGLEAWRALHRKFDPATGG